MDITCPKCAYVRLPVERVPEWQCPGCGVAYSKVGSKAAPVKQESPYQYDDENDTPRRRGLIWLLIGTIVVSLMAYQGYRSQTKRKAQKPIPVVETAPPAAQAESSSNEYDTDYRTFKTFLVRWDKALEHAYTSGSRVPESGLDTPEYRADIEALTKLQSEWKETAFLSGCYSQQQSVFADVLLSAKSHLNTYATAGAVPTDTATERMVDHYIDGLNRCLPERERLEGRP